MADNQGSARVTLKEIDLSQVRDQEQLPQGVPAAVVGTSKRGPAFVPHTFATIQQFNEKFGSLQEASKESNANRFGPLALNEWMRNAQAGTFLRVLGAGSGDGTLSNGRTTGAGFVVGDSNTYDANNKIAKNEHATITNANLVGAQKAGRTHFLGCFMKDAAGSTFLQDAGIQLNDAQATLTIDFDPDNNTTGLPEQGSTIALTGGNATITYTFSNNNIQQNIDVTTHNTPLLLAAAFAARVDSHSNFSASVVQAGGVNTAKVLITQVTVGEAGNKPVTLNLSAASREVIKIESGSTSTFNSTTGDQIRMDGGGATQAFITLSVHDEAIPVNLNNNNNLILKALKDDRELTDAVTITFKNDAAFGGDDSDVFEVVAGDQTLNVRIGENGLNTLTGQKETLSNLAAAINGANGTQLAGLLTASLSANGQTLAITQKNKGKLDGQGGDLDAIAEIVMPDLSFALNESTGTGEDLEFIGGTNGSGTITFTFTDQPRVGDNFTLISTSGATNTFKFIANNNGNSNGKVHTDMSSVNIELGSTLAGTMEFIKSAIESAEAIVVVNDVLTVTNTSNTVTVVQDTAGPSGDNLVTFNMSDKVTASTASSSLVGNFGEKTTSFAGGGGSAAPVIRGLLMTPQGVVPSLSLDTTTYNAYTGTTTELSNLDKEVASAANVINFGNNPANNLIGYELGKVVSNGFVVFLNGFSNTIQPNVLNCSFDPESVNYFAKVLNTDPAKLEECGHYLHVHWDIAPSIAEVSMTGIFKAGGDAADTGLAAFCLHSEGERAAEVANSPDFESFDTRFRTAVSPWIMSQKFGGVTKKLFRLHALDDGAAGNDRYRVLVSDLRSGKTVSDWSTFTLSLEAFDSDPVNGEVIVVWKNLTLDPDSRNFIGRVIGNKNIVYSFSKKKLVEDGEFEVRNSFVRVELTEEVMAGDLDVSTLPCGFKGYKTLNTGYADLFDESGTNGSGAGRLLADSTLTGLTVLPLPLVKTITRLSGANPEASSALPWGVKFAKKKKAGLHGELSEIRLNSSITSWTKFLPDMGDYPFVVDSDEEFSLENISLLTASPANWSTSIYERNGTASANQTLIDIDDHASGESVKYLKFRCLMQGGFDGLNIFNKEKADMSSIAAYREAVDEKDDQSFTGATVESFKKAIDVLSDKSATELQLLAIPGMREPLVTDYAIIACETRFDAMLVMDIEEIAVVEPITDSAKPHVQRTITRFDGRQLDTSFAAAYFPDVISRRSSNNTPIQVPPSVCMLGVMSQNDTLADPWFAPAGLTRGRLNASSAKVQMNRDLLNNLYDADINPIYIPAGRSGEVYAFGQKTLLQNQSALDRINVRRLLINIRRKVKAVANTLLFEPNRASTLERFSALVEPIMADVQARQGVERYKVQIDTSTTTQNDVENNTIRGKVYLQPTKSVEFISLDFVVTNSID